MTAFKKDLVEMRDVQLNKEKLLCAAAFLFFALVAAHKLTNAPLWFDEAIEYWFSKVMFGELPFPYSSGLQNMYQRIVSTFQPPLYNVVMHFWLKVSDSEWWFRFFGVVMGFVGMIGLYKTMRKATSAYVAAIAVAFSACVYHLAYYWQECAEYCLMLGALFWTVYFWFCLIENPSKRNIICFTISAAIPVYSQYGAAFPVIAMALVALVYVIALKDREKTVAIIVADAAALLAAALPLYFFFLKKQMLNQQGGEISLNEISFSGGPVYDFLYNLGVVFRFSFFSNYSEAATIIFFAIVLLMFVFAVALTRNVGLRLFAITNIIAWVLYYISVKLGVYSYGKFGGRYNLFFIPLWIVLFFWVAVEFCSILVRYLPKKAEVKSLCVGCGLCFVFCFCCFNWTSRLADNWSKQDCRGVVAAWFEAGADSSNTIVYSAANPAFAYYVRQAEQFDELTERNVLHYVPSHRNKSEAEHREYVNSMYGENWPDEIYVVSLDCLNAFIASIISNGYEREVLYTNRACLVRLFKP